MDTTSLATFHIVATQGSLAAAGRELGLTANAIALRLRTLEQEFGTPLVRRSGRTVVPTEAGHAVLKELPEVLERLRDLRAAAQSGEVAGELRVGAIATALTGILPPLLERLSSEHPKLSLHLEPGTSGELYDRVASGHLDAGAIVAPDFDLPKSLEFLHLRREPLVLLVPGHERRTDPLEVLSTEPVILYDRNQWGGRQASTWLENTGLRYHARFELDALDAIAVMVGRGLGVSVVPEWAGPRPEGLSLRSLPLPGPTPTRVIGIAFKRHGPRSRLVTAFNRLARAYGDVPG